MQLPLATDRLLLRLTGDEEAYRLAMERSHHQLEPRIYPPGSAFRFHPGKILIDILRKDERTRVGGFSIHAIQWDVPSCELGYWIVPECQGQGLMREAAGALIEQLFADRTFTRIGLSCDHRNERSVALALRLGFQHEASLQGIDAVSGETVVKHLFARYAS